MTFVGKILVIVIMAFSLLFLGVSTVVFTTATNWKDATTKEKEKVTKLQKQNSDANEAVAVSKKALDAAKSEHDAAKKELDNRITTLEADVKRGQEETTKARTELEVALVTTKSSLAEAEDRKKETDQLRTQKSAVEKQANEFKLHQSELNDQIRVLTRELDVAKVNNKDLREKTSRLSSLLRSKGLSDDISQVKGIESPPVVQGEVARVDRLNKRIEITIGSDDGLVVGHELYLYRTKPIPEYLGKVVIVSVDPDQAVAKVIGTTNQGKKIQEGDIVSSTLKPRS